MRQDTAYIMLSLAFQDTAFTLIYNHDMIVVGPGVDGRESIDLMNQYLVQEKSLYSWALIVEPTLITY